MDQYNGILNVYKEKGYTSFDAVAHLRGILHQKKVGHTGTLDPMATGVLPVCLGKGTKVCGMLTDWDKEYVTELRLGQVTDTLDVTGTLIGGDPQAALALPEEEIVRAVHAFDGGYDQIPPMYSALKKDGKRLYDLARAGISVERSARSVRLYELEILGIRREEVPVVRLRVLCSKGTYIRSLCDDIGARLGCGGTMQSLVRTRVGPFTLEGARTLGAIEAARDLALERGDVAFTDSRGNACPSPESLGVAGIDSLFADLAPAQVKAEGVKPLQNGNKLAPDLLELSEGGAASAAEGTERVRLYFPDGTFAGIYAWDGKEYRPEKVFL